MTNAMDCERFNDRLMAYLEHETDDATRSAIERHAVTCGDCGEVLADLRKLRIDATNLPELAPSRDLWSGIAARIEAPVVPIGTVRDASEVRSAVTRRWTRRAAIAASLVAAAGIGYFAPRPGARSVSGVPAVETDTAARLATTTEDTALTARAVTPVPSATVASTTAARAQRGALELTPSAARPLEVQAAVARLNADYDREITKLRALIEQRRNQVDPVTVAIIEQNLQVIDNAIADCRKAIARDPASRFLIESLNQSLQTKVELMRTATLLPSRT